MRVLWFFGGFLKQRPARLRISMLGIVSRSKTVLCKNFAALGCPAFRSARSFLVTKPFSGALQLSSMQSICSRSSSTIHSSSRVGICTTRPRQSRSFSGATPGRLHTQYSTRQLPGIGSTRSSWQMRAEAGAGGGSGDSGVRGKGYSSGSDPNSEGGGLFAAYNAALQQHPLLVKAITTAILSAIGNVICQVFVEKKSDLDWRRINTFTVLGLLWVAPCLHFWYGSLNRLVTLQGNAGALTRMACDQLAFAPLFVGSMMAILTALDGKPDRVADTLRADLPSAVRANWALWVPAQFLNFRFVPAQYQVLFSNVVALAWNVYFSFATRPKTAEA
eukprot:GHRQ01003107.1.p1 GENE.GHRQ01003107.1~~GHRQ01003107.1.p1  ORF type:complete len:333 (+),score=75.77 GHRQ01003107.1:397-1395(+)